MGSKDDDLRNQHMSGEISDAEYMRRLEANCKHVREIEEKFDRWIAWCERCGKKLDEGYYSETSTGTTTTTSSGGFCGIIAFFMLAIAATGIYGVIELVI